MAGYQVKLPVFEGPFDLLFHLMEEQKIDIFDIPMATITAQYLDYLLMMEIMDMDIASSFLVMAATLMEIKSKMLLPKPELDQMMTGDEDIDGVGETTDARQDLVARLLEYKRFKMTAFSLREMERQASRIYSRSLEYEPHPEEILQLQIGANDLLDLFQGLVRRRMNPPVHKVIVDRISIIERIEQIRKIMRQRRGYISFHDLIRDRGSRLDMVLAFLAVLEMAKTGEMDVKQKQNFSPITVSMSGDDEKPDPVSATG